MSGFDPDAFLAKAARQPAKPAPFDPDAFLAKQGKQPQAADAGSPLERALATQSGDVVVVDTPTGPAKFTRNGERYYDPEESRQMQQAGDARLKERALEGGLSFISGGGPMVDELAGAAKAMAPDVRGSQILETYRKGRDQARADVEASTRHASPQLEVAGVKVPVLPLAGAMVPALAAPLPGGALARIGSAAVQGAENAGASSTADLTRGEAGDFAKDVGIGGGAGLVTSGLAEGVSAPLRALARLASKEAGAADDAVVAGIQATKDKALKSATSSMGGIAAGGVNSIEKMEQVLANPANYDPAVVAEAQAMRALPEVQRAVDRAASGNLDKLRRFIPDYDAAELARAEALAAADPAAVAAEAGAKLQPGAIVEDLGSKAWRSLGQRAVLGAAGSALGSGLDALTGNGESSGMKYGGLAGLLAGPGAVQFMRNQAGSPVVQSGMNRLVSALLKSSAAGVSRGAPALTPVAQKRLPKAYAAMLEKYGVP